MKQTSLRQQRDSETIAPPEEGRPKTEAQNFNVRIREFENEFFAYSLDPNGANDHKLLGRFCAGLCKEGYISPHGLKEFLGDCHKELATEFIGALLVERALIDIEAITHVLTKYLKIYCLPLTRYEVPADPLDCITGDTARKYRVLPIDEFGGVLCLAVANPLDTRSFEELAKQTKMALRTVYCPGAILSAMIEQYYPVRTLHP